MALADVRVNIFGVFLLGYFTTRLLERPPLSSYRRPLLGTMIIAVGSGDRIATVLPELRGLLDRPLVTLERNRLCKRDGELFGTPHALPEVDERGLGVWHLRHHRRGDQRNRPGYQ